MVRQAVGTEEFLQPFCFPIVLIGSCSTQPSHDRQESSRIQGGERQCWGQAAGAGGGDFCRQGAQTDTQHPWRAGHRESRSTQRMGHGKLTVVRAFKITHALKKMCNSSGILQSCLSLLNSRQGAYFGAG